MTMLLPCPFCGGRARTHTEEVAYETWFGAECTDCGATTSTCPTPEDGYALWNTRAQAGGDAELLLEFARWLEDNVTIAELMRSRAKLPEQWVNNFLTRPIAARGEVR